MECLVSVPISAEVRIQDNAGNHAISSMIRTMPQVVSVYISENKVVLKKTNVSAQCMQIIFIEAKS